MADEALTLGETEAIMRSPTPGTHDIGVGLNRQSVYKVELVRSPVSPLRTLLEIERVGPWPERLEEYRLELLRFVAMLEGSAVERELCQTELDGLLSDELAGLLQCRDDDERIARRDAFNELIADTAGLAEALRLASTRLDPTRPPNLISFLRAKVIWRANDILESETRRHSRRILSVPEPLDEPSVAHRKLLDAKRTQRRVLVNQILRTFGSDDPVDARILSGLMEGESIAELARRTGRSRQQIYRFLQRIRDWSNGSEGSAE